MAKYQQSVALLQNINKVKLSGKYQHSVAKWQNAQNKFTPENLFVHPNKGLS